MRPIRDTRHPGNPGSNRSPWVIVTVRVGEAFCDIFTCWYLFSASGTSSEEHVAIAAVSGDDRVDRIESNQRGVSTRDNDEWMFRLILERNVRYTLIASMVFLGNFVK